MQRGNEASATIWHRRLGHASTKKMKEMADLNMIPKQAIHYEANQCTVCNLTKPMRRPVPHQAEKSGEITVQVDYLPTGREEIGWKGEVGAYVFASRQSKIVKVIPVKSATSKEAAEALDIFLTSVAPFMREKITCIQSDAGSQFLTKEWDRKCSEYHLKSRNCPVDHQAMNGQVERVQGLIVSKSRAILEDEPIPKKYWPLAMETAAYLLNRTPHTALNGKTPLEECTGEVPDLSRARVFGSTAYVQIPKRDRRGKFERTAWKGIMVGYSTCSPEWLILDPASGTIRKAYSVIFQENKCGFDTKLSRSNRAANWYEENEEQTRDPIGDLWEHINDTEVVEYIPSYDDDDAEIADAPETDNKYKVGPDQLGMLNILVNEVPPRQLPN